MAEALTPLIDIYPSRAGWDDTDHINAKIKELSALGGGTLILHGPVNIRAIDVLAGVTVKGSSGMARATFEGPNLYTQSQSKETAE